MMGILQLKDDSIYVTISEEPDEDTKYGEKMQTLYSILKQTNVDVTMPEPDMREKPRTVSGWRIPLSAGNYKYESKVITKSGLSKFKDYGEKMLFDNDIISKEEPYIAPNYKYNYNK